MYIKKLRVRLVLTLWWTRSAGGITLDLDGMLSKVPLLTGDRS